jgi:DedD protein
MENRLKERLTGAAILVALIVLLVPEMFRGQRSDVAVTASSSEGPPVRSYTIDLSNGPARKAPLQSTPTTPAAAATDGPVATASAPESPPASTPPANSAPPTATTKAPSPNGIVASLPSPRAGGGTWSVQLGLFSQRDNAERLVHAAQSKGFSASVSERDAKGLYHVQIGSLADRAAAQAMQTRLHDQGLPAAVVPPPSAAVKTHL